MEERPVLAAPDQADAAAGAEIEQVCAICGVALSKQVLQQILRNHWALRCETDRTAERRMLGHYKGDSPELKKIKQKRQDDWAGYTVCVMKWRQVNERGQKPANKAKIDVSELIQLQRIKATSLKKEAEISGCHTSNSWTFGWGSWRGIALWLCWQLAKQLHSGKRKDKQAVPTAIARK